MTGPDVKRLYVRRAPPQTPQELPAILNAVYHAMLDALGPQGVAGSGSLRGGGASFFGLEPSAMTCSKLSTRDVGISLSMAPCVLANVGRSFPKEPPRAIS